jgi:hypothetical protein
VLNETDAAREDGLPEFGGRYVFMTFSQPDGSLVIEPVYGAAFCLDPETRNVYRAAVAEQIEADRVRYPSKYDLG